MEPALSLAPDAAPTPRPVEDWAAARRLKLGNLSDCFDPFLARFVRQAFAAAGEVWVVRRGPAVDGLLIYNVLERVGSIFARQRPIAESLFALHDAAVFFSPFPIGRSPEKYPVYALALDGRPSAHRFSHPVRMAREEDRAEVLAMMRELYGRLDGDWLPGFSGGAERCFVVPVAGEIVAAGWVSVVPGHGRLHSLSVRPRYRRIGVGTDLWWARTLWAAHAGARRVVSEISEHNVASRAIAVAGGMRAVDALFLSANPGPSGDHATGAPQLGQTLSVTSTRVPQ